MTRIGFSILVSGLISLAACGITQATPIAPLSAVVASNAANTTRVHYRHWHHHYWHHGGYPLAGYWNYYRTFGPGRGNNEESTR
jgi:hypothetical protein